MQINVKVGVQFMLKNRETDIPTMQSRTVHVCPMEVSVSPELEPYVEEYSKSVNDPAYDPHYEISQMLLKIITPRVKKAYPEHWRKEKNSEGKTIQFKPSEETILETAISMDIDDRIDARLNDNKDAILKKLGVEPPADTAEMYLANVFVTRLGWSA
jgi:hypothetical protein